MGSRMSFPPLPDGGERGGEGDATIAGGGSDIAFAGGDVTGGEGGTDIAVARGDITGGNGDGRGGDDGGEVHLRDTPPYTYEDVFSSKRTQLDTLASSTHGAVSVL